MNKFDKLYLFNRYGDAVCINRVADTDNVYKLIINEKDPSDNDVVNVRYIYDSWPDNIYAVDPSGGPFISVGKNNLSLIGTSDLNAVTIDVEKITVELDKDTTKTYIHVKSIEKFK